MEFRVTRSKHFKVVKETGWSQINIWSLTAVDFLDLDRLFVKGEIPEYSPTLNFKMTVCFTVIGSIASTTRKLINNVRA